MWEFELKGQHLKIKKKDKSKHYSKLVELEFAKQQLAFQCMMDKTMLVNLQSEHSRLKEDFRSLFTTNEQMKTNYCNF